MTKIIDVDDGFSASALPQDQGITASAITLEEDSAPLTPGSGESVIYVLDGEEGKLKIKDENGNERSVGDLQDFVDFDESYSAGNPSAGFKRIYAKSGEDGRLFLRDSAGAEVAIGSILDRKDFTKGSAPADPASTEVRVYAKTGEDDKLFMRDSAGNETAIGSILDTIKVPEQEFTKGSAPSDPAATEVKVYAKTGEDDKLFMRDSSGNETAIGSVLESVQVEEIATPSTPPSGNMKVYAKTDGLLYSLNDAGTETALGGSVATFEGHSTNAAQSVGPTATTIVYEDALDALTNDTSMYNTSTGIGTVGAGQDGTYLLIADAQTAVDDFGGTTDNFILELSLDTGSGYSIISEEAQTQKDTSGTRINVRIVHTLDLAEGDLFRVRGRGGTATNLAADNQRNTIQIIRLK